MAKKIMAIGDMHAPHHCEIAVEVAKQTVKQEKPDLLLMLGDMLSCDQFSAHPPTFGMPESDYEGDLEFVSAFMDYCQRYCGRLVFIEGNHEYRIDRWAAATAEGKGAYSMLAPRIQLSRDRKNFTYVKYGSVDGKYPHYKVNSRIVAVHGWSYARHATKNHLQLSQGKSVIHGHTHRADTSMIQNVWRKGDVIQARSAGCLCKQVPLYGTGRPVEWINGFILGYLGSHTDCLYTLPIVNGGCVLPSGKEITA